MTVGEESAGGSAEGVLEALADPDRRSIPAQGVAVVVAHPDDESIGCGAQLPKLQGVTVIHVTDGAPLDGRDARAHGFETPEDYAAARRRELEAAMAVAGLGPQSLISLDVPDQAASPRLAEIARRLAALAVERNLATIFTHAFEGGHPDHDAVAFAVTAAGRLLARDGHDLATIEMPFYRLGPSGPVAQSFAPSPGRRETEIRLTADERRLKQRMYDAHASQRQVLAALSTEAERFRPAPRHDFLASPNEGRILYELFPWGMTSARWRELAAAASDELGLKEAS